MTRRIIFSLLALTALASGPAHAEWEYVASSDFYARYIDPDSASRDGDIVRIWEVDDQAAEDRFGVRSLRARTEYDCSDRAYRIVHLSGHSKPLTGGRVIFSRPGQEDWSPVAPGTLGEATLDRICED